MSMPNIPDVKPIVNIEKKHSVNLLIASIGFEELGLANIIDAEAEKIQFILGMLGDHDHNEKNPPTLDELLQVNKSAEKMVKEVIQKEMLLDFMLEDAIELLKTTSETGEKGEDKEDDKEDEVKDIESLSVSHSAPVYTGSGSQRVGSTTVTLTFTLSDDTTATETETFSDIKMTESKDFNYTVGSYDVVVQVTVTATGNNNSMNITGATAEIISKVVNH